MQIAQAVPLNLVTGFLGAGKTTAIRHLLETRQPGERWAVLVNEFGKVGIDQAAMNTGAQDIAIREVPGGCLCCTNHLPLQVGLSQLLARAKPTRVLIEPTGLGHPARVLEALREPHWASALDVRATLTLVDARELADARVREHETFRAQIEAADVLIFSKDDVLTEAERAAARDFANGLLPPKAHVHFMKGGALPRAWLDLPARTEPVRRSLLHVPAVQTGLSLPSAEAMVPPYHYSEVLAQAAIAGWVLPRDWVFEHDALLTVLFSIQPARRVKGVFHTDKGWIFFNATTRDTAINSEVARADSRLEVIADAALDWPAIEAGLMATRVSV